jgi:hypothetical protein
VVPHNVYRLTRRGPDRDGAVSAAMYAVWSGDCMVTSLRKKQRIAKQFCDSDLNPSGPP